MSDLDEVPTHKKADPPPAYLLWMLVVLALLMAGAGFMNHWDRANRSNIERVDINTTQRPY